MHRLLLRCACLWACSCLASSLRRRIPEKEGEASNRSVPTTRWGEALQGRAVESEVDELSLPVVLPKYYGMEDEADEPRDGGEEGSDDSSATEMSPGATPVTVFYLFLVGNDFEQERIWIDFFDRQPRSQFEALVHCTDPLSCLRTGRTDLFHVISTVPSTYCDNLVNPILALLENAVHSAQRLANPRDPRHKFVLLSHNSVPIKPFEEVQQLLIEGKEGMASFDWEPYCGGIRASQWFVLSYPQVETLLKVSGGPTLSLDDSFPQRWQWYPAGCQGCSDEQYFFASLFGNGLKSPDLVNPHYWWIDWARAKVDQPQDLVLVKGPLGPNQVRAFSAKGLCSLRSSKEVFLRKVSPDAVFLRAVEAGGKGLRAAFRQLVLSPSSPCLV